MTVEPEPSTPEPASHGLQPSEPSAALRRTTPVTVVAGGDEAALLAVRLGAGLAAADPGERVAVIAESAAPEPATGVDWLVVGAVEGDRTEGCPCCRSRLDLVQAIRLVLERPRPAQRVIVVVDPARDLSTVTQTILSEPDLQRLVDLDSVIATVDAVSLGTRLALDLPFDDALGLQRLAVADRVLVARAIDLTDDALGRVLRAVRTVNRFGYVAVPSVSPIDMSALVDLRAWHGAPQLAAARLEEPFVVADGADLPVTVHCEVDGLLDPDAVETWFDQVIAAHGPRLLRLQGAVAVTGQEHRVCCRGVRSYATSHSEQEHPPGDRSLRSVVAIVGYGLDADALRHEFESTRLS